MPCVLWKPTAQSVCVDSADPLAGTFYFFLFLFFFFCFFFLFLWESYFKLCLELR